MFVQNKSDDVLNSRVMGVKTKVSPGEIVEVTEEEGKHLVTAYSTHYQEVPKPTEKKAEKTEKKAK